MPLSAPPPIAPPRRSYGRCSEEWTSRATAVLREVDCEEMCVVVPSAMACLEFVLELSWSLLDAGIRLRRVVAMDPKMFCDERAVARLAEMEEALGGRNCELVAKREPKTLETWLSTMAKVVEAQEASFVAFVAGEALEGIESLRITRAFARRAARRGTTAFLAPGACPPPALLRQAAAGVVYAPVESYVFSAREVRDDPGEKAWALQVANAAEAIRTGSSRTLGKKNKEDIVVVVPERVDGRGYSAFLSSPVVRFAKDQLDLVRQRATHFFDENKGAYGGEPFRLTAILNARMVRSSAARYVDGGYEALHYVKTSPNDREVCFELEMSGDNDDDCLVGFVSLGATSFGESRRWPFALPERPHADVATVTRLVVKPRARGLGAADLLICHAANLFCRAEGIPVRIATRKLDVVEKVFRNKSYLKEDDATRRLRLLKKAQDAVANAKALVPYDPEHHLPGALSTTTDSSETTTTSSDEYFHTHTPNSGKARGKNHTWYFWYVGSDVLHPRSKRNYTYVGGDKRFVPVLS